MTTDEATKELGRLLAFRQGDEKGYRYITRAVHYGRKWEWTKSGESLVKAYRSLGAEPPSGISHGYAWHCGLHPIQLAADEAGRRMDGR